MTIHPINSAGIIPLSKQNGEWKVFLIQYRGYERFWGCPKGHLQPEETHEEAACRELNEETGLKVMRLLHADPLLEEFYWMKEGERLFKQILFFIAEVEGEVKLQLDEITSGQWFSLPEAIQQVVYPEGKAILKQTKKILETT